MFFGFGISNIPENVIEGFFVPLKYNHPVICFVLPHAPYLCMVYIYSSSDSLILFLFI